MGLAGSISRLWVAQLFGLLIRVWFAKEPTRPGKKGERTRENTKEKVAAVPPCAAKTHLPFPRPLCPSVRSSVRPSVPRTPSDSSLRFYNAAPA